LNTSFSLIHRAVRAQLALAQSLFRWVARRPDVPSGTVGFAYVGAVSLLLYVLIGVSSIELVGLHVLLPWKTARIVADVLSLGGLAWMLGLTASYHVHPHLVTVSGLSVRHGAHISLTIPLDSIDTVAIRERSHDSSRTLRLDRDEQGNVLNLVVGSRTNVELTLRRQVIVPVGKGPEPITTLRLYADDARALVSHVHALLGTRDETPR
jgi:hypothetical protein